jgi:hypothetical protein
MRARALPYTSIERGHRQVVARIEFGYYGKGWWRDSGVALGLQRRGGVVIRVDFTALVDEVR